MKNIFIFLIILFACDISFAQVTNKIQADSVKIYQVGNHPAELIIENSTKSKTGGVLKNTGNGRTQFDYTVDSAWIVDSILYVKKGPVTNQYNIKAGLGTISGSGIDSLLSQNSIIGSGKSSNKFRLKNDTTVSGNTRNLVYGLWGEDQPRYKANTPDTAALAGQMRMSHFSSVAALKGSSYHLKGFKLAFTESYYGNADRVSGAKYVWVDTSTHADDSSLYIKPLSVSGAGRWVYCLDNGRYNLRQLGVVADGSTDNWYRIQYIVNSIPSGNGTNVFAPSGQYYLSQTLTFTNKQFVFQGDGKMTEFLFPASKSGFIITRTGGYEHGSYKAFSVTALSKNSTDTAYHTADGLLYHGVEVGSVNNFEDVYVNNFSGFGFHVFGWISFNGTNVSGSHFTDIHVSQCGGGIYIGKADASGCTINNPDIRDCSGYAIESESFYGNYYNGGLIHNNTAGIYWNPSQVNCNDVFDGTYFEPSQPDGVGVGYVTFIGGWPGATFTGVAHFSRKSGDDNENVHVYKRGGSGAEKIGIGRDASGTPQFLRQTADNDKFYEQNSGSSRGIYTNNWVEKYSLVNGASPLFHRIGWDAKLDNSIITRGFRTPMMGFGNYWINGGHIDQWASDTAASGLVAAPYFPGDKIWNSNYTNGGTVFWVCYQRGSVSLDHNYLTTVDVTNPYGTDTLYVDGYTDRIQEGDYIHFNGLDRYVIWKKNDGTKLKISSSTSVFTTPQRISYNAPLWAAISGSGGGSSYTFTQSLANSSGTVTLVNDNSTPGNSKYYGTDGSGTKGFFTLPSGSVSATSNEVVYGTGSNVTSSPNLKNDGTTVTVNTNNSNGPAGFNLGLAIRGNAPALPLIWDNTYNTGFYPFYDASTGTLSFAAISGTYPGSISTQPFKIFSDGTNGSLYGWKTTNNYTGLTQAYSSVRTLLGANLIAHRSQNGWRLLNTSDYGVGAILDPNNGYFSIITGLVNADVSSGSIAENTKIRWHIDNNGYVFYDQTPPTYSTGGRKMLVFNSSTNRTEIEDVPTVSTPPIQNLNSQYTDAGNTSTSETDLMSYTLGAGQLANDGDWLEISAWFSTTSNTNTKELKFYFGGSLIQDWGPSTIPQGSSIEVRIQIIRTGAATQKFVWNYLPSNFPHAGFNTGSATLSGTNVIKFTGQSNTATDDIVQKSMTIVYHSYTP